VATTLKQTSEWDAIITLMDKEIYAKALSLWNDLIKIKSFECVNHLCKGCLHEAISYKILEDMYQTMLNTTPEEMKEMAKNMGVVFEENLK
jgi:hypothetical protein